ncbi:hypothetical protein Tco_1090655 [Tanacetum coccineum]|uniref:Uncharacterized protein n=1 Tax=Tanacetum coccineum TaxID=301880 RepID=A0ABQ5I713_9ASTR
MFMVVRSHAPSSVEISLGRKKSWESDIDGGYNTGKANNKLGWWNDHHMLVLYGSSCKGGKITVVILVRDRCPCGKDETPLNMGYAPEYCDTIIIGAGMKTIELGFELIAWKWVEIRTFILCTPEYIDLVHGIQSFSSILVLGIYI